MTETDMEQEAQRLLDADNAEIRTEIKTAWNTKPDDYAAGSAILKSKPHLQIHILFAILNQQSWKWLLSDLQNSLFARNLPWTATDLERLLAHFNGKSP